MPLGRGCIILEDYGLSPTIWLFVPRGGGRFRMTACFTTEVSVYSATSTSPSITSDV